MNSIQPTRLLITAGATSEPIDEVRYLSNRSSGRLGCLIALASATMGYEVTLLRAISSILPAAHPRLNSIEFTSTRDLSATLHEYWPSHDVLIMAAAVADFTPIGGQMRGKLHRDEALSINFAPTKDIVGSIASETRSDQKIIAFALESNEELEMNAKNKLQRKGVDAVIANPLETMEATTISAIVYCRDGRSLTPSKNLSKPAFARWLIAHLQEITASS